MFGVLRQKTAYLAVATALMALVVSCVSTGAPKLSESNVRRIVDGETTKSEVSALFARRNRFWYWDREVRSIITAEVSTENHPIQAFQRGTKRW